MQAAAEEHFDGLVRQVEPLERTTGESDDLVGEDAGRSPRPRVRSAASAKHDGGSSPIRLWAIRSWWIASASSIGVVSPK
jgi:hypothetical protein